MGLDARPRATPPRQRWTGPLWSLAVIGGLTLVGWLGGRWFSAQAPRSAVPGGAIRPAPHLPPALTPVPENAEIAGMRQEALAVLAELEQCFPMEPSVLCSMGSLYALYGLDDQAQQRAGSGDSGWRPIPPPCTKRWVARHSSAAITSRRSANCARPSLWTATCLGRG